MGMFLLGVMLASVCATIAMIQVDKGNDQWAGLAGPAFWILCLGVGIGYLFKQLWKKLTYRAILVDKENNIWVVPYKYADALRVVNKWKFPEGEAREMFSYLDAEKTLNFRYCPPDIWKGYPEARKVVYKRAWRIYKREQAVYVHERGESCDF